MPALRGRVYFRDLKCPRVSSMLYGVDWREGGGPDTKQDGGRVFREHQTPWSIAKDHRNAGGKRAREQSGRASGSENWQSFLPLSNWIRAAAPTSWRWWRSPCWTGTGSACARAAEEEKCFSGRAKTVLKGQKSRSRFGGF